MSSEEKECEVTLKENIKETVSIVEKNIDDFKGKCSEYLEKAKLKAVEAKESAVKLKDRVVFANRILKDDELYAKALEKDQA